MVLPPLLSGERRWLMVQLVVNGLLQAMLAVALALLIRDAFDLLMVTAPDSGGISLMQTGGGLLLVAFASAGLRWRERIDAERLGQSYAQQLRLLLFDRLSQATQRALQRRGRGGTLLRFIGDLNALRQWVSLGLARLSVAGVATVGVLSALLLVNPLLAGLVTILLFGGGVMALLLGRSLQSATRESHKWRARMAGNVTEKLAAMAVVQAYGQRRRERRRLHRHNQALFDAMLMRASRLGRLRALTELVTALTSGGVLLFGASLVATGQLTPGTVVAAMAVVGLLTPALRDLGRVHEYWHGAQVSRQKILGLLKGMEQLPRRRRGPRLQLQRGHIELRRIKVDGILRRVDAKVEAGERIAIAGCNGAGKSTLLAVIGRMLQPDGGRVLLDGQDIARCNLASVREQIGIVSPDLPLLRGTVAWNLRYRMPGATAEQLQRTIDYCALQPLIDQLPQGLSTRVSEGGRNLSQGQRARIALGRALLGDPGILLLDEADANFDADADRLLAKLLEVYPGTVILVSHRPGLLQLADRIWQMEEGGRLTEKENVATTASTLISESCRITHVSLERG